MQQLPNLNVSTLRARLLVPSVAPTSIWQALTDPGRMVRWFQQHQPLLGAADGPGQDAWHRGAYHFWSFFTPHAPPDPLHVLLEAHWPGPGDDRIRLRYGWELRGHKSEVWMELAPCGSGTQVGVIHSGMQQELPGLGSGRAYWTLVLENMRLYLLGRGGLHFHQRLAPGELGSGARGLATELVTPAGLDATSSAWELLAGEQAWDEGIGLLLPPGMADELDRSPLLAQPPHSDGAGGVSARLDWRWQRDALGLPGVLSWRLAGSGSRTRITIVQSGFDEGAAAGGGGPDTDEAHWLADWRSVLGQLRGQLDLGEDWSRVELE